MNTPALSAEIVSRTQHSNDNPQNLATTVQGMIEEELRKTESGKAGERESGTARHEQKDLLQMFLGNAPAAALTADKTDFILKREGGQITGFVVTDPKHGNIGIIDKSAVRWLNKDGWWWLMHISQGQNPGAVYVLESELDATVQVTNGQ